MKATIFASLLAAAGVVNALPTADGSMSPPSGGAGPDPSTVYLSGLAYGGTGCPQGTVTQIFSDDKTTVTLIYDQYQAQIGPGIDPAQSRANCQLNFNLHYPGGWQYSVFTAEYRGYIQADKGVTGVQKSIYYFSGDSRQCATQSNFNGPLTQDYNVVDTIDTTSTVWSPCGIQGMLNINSQVRLSGPANAQGYMTDDSFDGHFEHIIGIQWQKCTGK